LKNHNRYFYSILYTKRNDNLARTKENVIASDVIDTYIQYSYFV